MNVGQRVTLPLEPSSTEAGAPACQTSPIGGRVGGSSAQEVHPPGGSPLPGRRVLIDEGAYFHDLTWIVEVRIAGYRWENSMRRLATLLVAFLLAMGGVFATTAAPVQADPPGGTLRNVYSDLSFCHSYGQYGVQNDMWSSYLCERRVYGTSVYYFFWTFD